MKAQWFLRLVIVAVMLPTTVTDPCYAEDELADVLKAESNSSENIHRRSRLHPDLERARFFSREVLWQAGYVETGDGWKAVEELGSSTSQSRRLDEYFQKRQSSERSSPDQLKLASWCLSHDLRERGEAHLFQSLLLAPPGAETSEQMKRLRYRFVGQKLLSPFECAELERESETQARNLSHWLPRVSRLTTSAKLVAKNQPIQTSPTKEVEHHAAVPAMEQVLASADEIQAKMLVEALGRTRSYRATQTLACAALLSPSLQIRDAAIEALSTRKKDDFVPDLISLLRTPVEQITQTAVGPRGEKYSRFVWTQEDSTTIQSVDFRVFDFTTMNRWTYVRSFRHPSSRGYRYLPNGASELIKAHQMRNAVIAVDAWADRANEQADLTNERVNAILGTVCDSKSRNTPQDWWDWWADYEDVEPAPKRVVVVKEEQKLGKYVPPTVRVSCLVGGTPVWTESGMKPIEQIQVGDRVLSKHIESGELALKPVLHTTYRPPRKTLRIGLGSDSLQATGGHRFWVSGSGWTRTRELTAEQPLHTTTGTMCVTSLDAAEEAATYNLVVADFHTYFVGKNAILSHDVLPPKPTNKVVPGLGDE